MEDGFFERENGRGVRPPGEGTLPWPRVWRDTFGLALLIAIVLELVARGSGHRASVHDDAALWSEQRSRLEARGNGEGTQDVMVWVGSSRCAYGVDLATAESSVDRPAIQLAIRGGGITPIIGELAGSEVAPAVLVLSLAGPSLERPGDVRSESYLRYFEREWKPALSWDRSLRSLSESIFASQGPRFDPRATLRSWLSGQLIAYPDAARTQRDRSVLAPANALGQRVQGERGKAQLDRYLENREQGRLEASQWEDRLHWLMDDLQRLRRRGTKIAVVRFPSSGAYREIEERFYPREQYWRKVERACEEVGCASLHFEDASELASIATPDYSHVSAEDRVAFTRALLDLLAKRGLFDFEGSEGGVSLRLDHLSAKVARLIASGSVVRVVALVASPLLTRLYAPEELGVFFALLAVSGLFAVTATLGYPRAIPAARDDALSVSIARCARASLMMVVVLLASVLFMGGPSIHRLIGTEDFHQAAIYLPLLVALSGLVEVARYENTRRRSYGRVANAEILRGLLRALGALGLGLWSASVLSMIYAELSSRFVAWLYLKRARREQPRFDLGAVWKTAVKFRRFPLLTTPAVLINCVTLRLPLLALATLFGSSTAGCFALLQSVLGAPSQIVASSATDVIVGEAGRLSSYQGRRRVLRQVLWRVFPFTPLMLSLVFVDAESLVVLLFGEAWREAGMLLNPLAILYAFSVYGSAMASVLDTFGHQRARFLCELGRLTMMGGVFVAAQQGSWRPATTVYGFVIAGLLGYGLLMLAAWWVLRDPEARRAPGTRGSLTSEAETVPSSR